MSGDSPVLQMDRILRVDLGELRKLSEDLISRPVVGEFEYRRVLNAWLRQPIPDLKTLQVFAVIASDPGDDWHDELVGLRTTMPDAIEFAKANMIKPGHKDTHHRIEEWTFDSTKALSTFTIPALSDTWTSWLQPAQRKKAREELEKLGVNIPEEADD